MRNKLFISLTTAALLSLGLSGCGPTAAPTTEPTAKPLTTASSTPTVTPQSTAAAQQGAAKAVTDFYDGTFKLPHATIVAAQKVNTDHANYSAAVYSSKMEALIPSLKIIDKTTSSADRLAAFEYGYTASVLTIADSLTDSKDTFKFIIDPAQIKLSVNNTVGEIPATAVSVEYNGQPQTGENTATGVIHTIYKNGKWYIDASKN